jgi:hypothetical protein
MSVQGNNPNPSSFDGSTTGTRVTLGPGEFEVEESQSSTPAGLVFDHSEDQGCTGSIQAGETKTCTWTNVYVVAPPPL